MIHDTRGPERALRVSAHPAAGFLVLSTWRDGACVGTVRVRPAEAAELVSGLVHGLADLAEHGDVAEQIGPGAATAATVELPPV